MTLFRGWSFFFLFCLVLAPVWPGPVMALSVVFVSCFVLFRAVSFARYFGLCFLRLLRHLSGRRERLEALARDVIES